MTESSLPESVGAPAGEWSQLVQEFRPKISDALTNSILPFWRRTLDEERGGVFNCWNNSGTRLISRDKFTWSQGRFLWLWSRLAEATQRGLVQGATEDFIAHAARTFSFLQKHAFLDDGKCAFLLTEDGQPKEPIAGLGLAPSIYADCFVTMGFAEFARVTRDPKALEAAWELLLRIEKRIASGDCPTHPTPIPLGYEAYALAMIFLNVALVVAAACAELGATQREAAARRCTASAEMIFERFVHENGRIAEFRQVDGRENDTLLCRHVNPGHALEGLWMLLTVGAREKRRDWLARANTAVRFAFDVGWDTEHAGLLYYVDCEGGPPRGEPGSGSYEAAVRKNWDAKLWWVHSEAIFASLLSYRISGDAADCARFRHVFDYAFRVFPNPNREIGEWIQIRNRRGEPSETVVALPVKDPYHIARNLIQALELLAK
jgi:N-acylglucosamine 2-epimerase